MCVDWNINLKKSLSYIFTWTQPCLKTGGSNPSNKWHTVVMSLKSVLAQKHWCGNVVAIFPTDARRVLCHPRDARVAPLRRATNPVTIRCVRDATRPLRPPVPDVMTSPWTEPSTNCGVNIETLRRTGTRGARAHALLNHYTHVHTVTAFWWQI